jgi:hypothetical protein
MMKPATRVITKKRPPTTGTLIGVRLQPASLTALDAWRKKQDDAPTRPEAIRRLVEKSLNMGKTT